MLNGGELYRKMRDMSPAGLAALLSATVLGMYLFTALLLWRNVDTEPEPEPVIRVAARYLLEGVLESARTWMVARARTNMRYRFVEGGFGPVDLEGVGEISNWIGAMADISSVDFRLESLTFSYEDVKRFPDSMPHATEYESYGAAVFEARAMVGGSRFSMTQIYDVKVVDITPPAPEYTLFVRGRTESEQLNTGSRLILENGTITADTTGKIRFNGNNDIFVNLGLYDVNPDDPSRSLVPVPNIPAASPSFNTGMEHEPGLSMLSPLNKPLSHRTSLFGALLCSSPAVVEGPVYRRWLRWNTGPRGEIGLDPRQPLETAAYGFGNNSPEYMSGPPGVWRGVSSYYMNRASIITDTYTVAGYSARGWTPEGIVVCRSFNVEPDITPLANHGRAAVVAVNSVQIMRDIRKARPDAMLSILSINNRRNLRFSDMNSMDAYVYSGAGLNISGGRELRIRGNLAVEQLNMHEQRGDLTVEFDPSSILALEGTGNVAVTISPRVAWWHSE